MQGYVKADDFLAVLNANYKEDAVLSVHDVEALLAATSDADVRENKTATWKSVHVGGYTPGGNTLKVCSNCGWEFGTHMIYPDYKFCPMCGAAMRKFVQR